MAEVHFDHVYKTYGDTTSYVIRDLNLEIVDHEFLVLVGPSGCGKSTALRMIAGLEEISSGDLFIGGRRVNDVAPKDRDIAMVFQNYALYPHMSVFQNMAFSLKLKGMSRDEIDRRVQRAAAMLDIGAYLQRKPKQLSGGQRQRVALGRAIVREPQVFLMDEPLSNLDAKLRVQTRAEIARLHQQVPVTTVYVTHDQVEAMTMGDRIAVLNAGVIQQLGTPQELYDHPSNLFVAGFIGSPSMDFFNARLVRTGAGAEVQIGEGADVHTLTLTGEAFAPKISSRRAMATRRRSPARWTWWSISATSSLSTCRSPAHSSLRAPRPKARRRAWSQGCGCGRASSSGLPSAPTTCTSSIPPPRTASRKRRASSSA